MYESRWRKKRCESSDGGPFGYEARLKQLLKEKSKVSAEKADLFNKLHSGSHTVVARCEKKGKVQ